MRRIELAAVAVGLAGLILASGAGGGLKRTDGSSQAPWAVRLDIWQGTKDSPDCSGSIISHHLVLTAAHCLGSYNPNKMTLKVSTDLKTWVPVSVTWNGGYQSELAPLCGNGQVDLLLLRSSTDLATIA